MSVYVYELNALPSCLMMVLVTPPVPAPANCVSNLSRDRDLKRTNFQDVHVRISVRQLQYCVRQEVSIFVQSQTSHVEVIEHVVVHHVLENCRFTTDSRCKI